MSEHSVILRVFQAAKDGNIEFIRQILANKSEEEVRKTVNEKTGGATPLIAAVLCGHSEVVKYLVDSCSADIDLKGSARLITPPTTSIEQATPLWYAVAEGHLEVVKFLVSKSADVNTTNEKDKTPFQLACYDGKLEIVKFLVESKVDVNKANRNGSTPLHEASYNNRVSVVSYLLENGALSTKDNKGTVTSVDFTFPCNKLVLVH